MRIGRGDIRGQRARRRDRYRGCSVCGIRGAQCAECGLGAQLVALQGSADLALVVDGSFVASPRDSGGYGGAGLVLVRGDEVLAFRACGFRAMSSSDAELHAVIRGARWVPGTPIYTGARELLAKMTSINPDLAVHCLVSSAHSTAYALAKRLSIEGRCRGALETIPCMGVEFAAGRPKRSRAGRRRMAAEVLLERALHVPNFNGDFTAIAAQFGWTSGPWGRDNPAIRIAAQLWLEQHGGSGANTHQERSEDP